LTDNKRRQYTAEFKKEAVELVTRENYTVAQAASSLGISRSMRTGGAVNIMHGHRMLSRVPVIKLAKQRN
jgi:hypothetical protein